jgi:hypothetical protein
MLAGCEQIENQLVRWTGTEGSLHSITLVHLLAAGNKYDRLNVGVGGYLGFHMFGPTTALYFVQEHIVIGDPQLGIDLFGEDEVLQFENICDHIGSYMTVSGKYDHKKRRINVDKVIWTKEPEQRLDRVACEQLTEL